MRVQLQEQSGGKTIHHASIVLDGATSGMVTTAELIDALEELRKSPSIPSREQSRADAALDRAKRWTLKRPPAGVSGQFSTSFYFDTPAPWSVVPFRHRRADRNPPAGVANEHHIDVRGDNRYGNFAKNRGAHIGESLLAGQALSRW